MCGNPQHLYYIRCKEESLLGQSPSLALSEVLEREIKCAFCSEMFADFVSNSRHRRPDTKQHPESCLLPRLAFHCEGEELCLQGSTEKEGEARLGMGGGLLSPTVVTPVTLTEVHCCSLRGCRPGPGLSTSPPYGNWSLEAGRGPSCFQSAVTCLHIFPISGSS